jgi:hypothetical protein
MMDEMELPICAKILLAGEAAGAVGAGGALVTLVMFDRLETLSNAIEQIKGRWLINASVSLAVV